MAEGEVKYKVVIDDDGVEGQLKKSESKIGGIAGGIGKAFLGVAAAVSTAAIAAGAAAFKVGVEWESAFAGVKKTVDATDEELAILEQGILDMAKSVPLAATEIAGIAEAAGQLGIKNENILGFTRVMADLGVATNMTAEQAATSLARLANITQMPQEQFSRLGSTVVALGNNMATTESEIVDMSLRLAGAANQAGFSEHQMMGLSAALSSVGVEAQAGGGSMSRVLNMISIAAAKGGDDIAGFAKVAGMSAEEFAAKWEDDAAGAFDLFIQGLGKVQKEGGNVALTLQELGINETIATTALTNLAGAEGLLTEALGISAEAWDADNALSNEAAQRYATMESQLQILGNKFTDIGIQLYEGVQEPLGTALEAFNGFIDTIAEDGTLDMLVETIASLGGTLTEALVDLLPIILDLINQLLPPILEIIETLLPPLIELINLLLPPFMQLVETLLPPLINLFNTLMPPIMALISSLLPPLVDIITMLLEPIMQLIDMLLPPLINLFDMLKPAIDALMPVISFLAQLFSGVLGGAIKALMPIIETLMTILGGVLDFITGVFTGNWEQAWNGIVSIFKGIFNLIPAIVEGVINGAIAIINGIINGINGMTGLIGIPAIPNIPNVSLPRFHTGGIIEFEGGAEEGQIIARRGEMVLTEAQQAEVWKTLNQGGEPDTSAPIDISVQNNLKGNVVMDGRIVGQVVWENIDDVAAFQ